MISVRKEEENVVLFYLRGRICQSNTFACHVPLLEGRERHHEEHLFYAMFYGMRYLCTSLTPRFRHEPIKNNLLTLGKRKTPASKLPYSS